MFGIPRDKVIAWINSGYRGLTLQGLVDEITRDNFGGAGFYIPHYSPKRYSLWDRETGAIREYLRGSGYVEIAGSEITDNERNFDDLNIFEDHPSRNDHDTFVLNDGRILRTHTTASTVEHLNKAKKYFVLGKAYRNEKSSRHVRNFHQLDLIDTDRDYGLRDLHNSILNLIFNTFYPSRPAYILRRSYFPFTSFSCEIDLVINGSFVEILGAGMLNTKFVKAPTLACGIGVERLIIAKYLTLYNRKISIADILKTFL